MSSPVAVPRGLPRLDCRRRARCAALGEGVRARNTVIAHISRGPSLLEPVGCANSVGALISNFQGIDSPNVPLWPALNPALLRFDHTCGVVAALGATATACRR
jgi:hypothetical protein